VLLRPGPLPFDDFRLHLSTVCALDYQIASVDGGLHRIANDHSVSGIAGMLGKFLTAAKVDDIPNLHLINGVAMGSAFVDSVVRSYIHQLAGLKFMTRRGTQTDRTQEKRKYNGNSNEGE
jgi:hypothetical protein